MPLRSDPTAWFNLPGIMAAYQPIAAPGPLLARYNQAHGGDNRYKAVDGVAPTWAGHTGWSFSGTQYLTTGLTINTATATILVRFYQTSAGYYLAVGGTNLEIHPRRTTAVHRIRFTGTNNDISFSGTSGVFGFSGVTAYRDGLPIGSSLSGTLPTTTLYIGSLDAIPTAPYNGFLRAIVIYNRVLSPTEVWSVSRQMAYCNVNPDWSAWGRRRKWFYAPAAEQISEITGQGAVTLANIAPSATGTVEVAGTASATIANLTGQSAGLVDIAGVGDGLLNSVSGQAAGAVEIAGAGVVTLAALLPSANGSVAIAGTASVTLAGIAGTATASVGEVPVIGQGSITLANLTGQAAAAVAIAGNGETTLSGLTGQAIGAVSISGIAAITLVDIAETATGQALVLGSAAVQFAAIVAAATGTVTTYIPATQHIGLTLKQRSFEWHMKDRP